MSDSDYYYDFTDGQWKERLPVETPYNPGNGKDETGPGQDSGTGTGSDTGTGWGTTTETGGGTGVSTGGGITTTTPYEPEIKPTVTITDTGGGDTTGAGTPATPPPAAPPPAQTGPTLADQLSDWEARLASIAAALKLKYDEYVSSMKGVLGGGVPSAPDLNPYIQSMGSLTSQLSAGPGQFQGEAERYRAQMMGYSDITNPDGSVTTAEDQYRQDLQRMRGAQVGDMQGLTAEERNLMERNKASTIQGMEEQAQRQLESVMGDRGGMGALAAADEYRRQISDVNLQYDLEIAQSDYARKITEIQRNDQQYALQVQQGNALASDYLNMRKQGITDALTGYMQQASLATQQYTNEVDSVIKHADLIYKAAQLEMGADSQMMQMLSDQWEMMIAPYMTQLQITQMNQQIAQGQFNSVLSLLTLPFKIAGMILGFA